LYLSKFLDALVNSFLPIRIKKSIVDCSRSKNIFVHNMIYEVQFIEQVLSFGRRVETHNKIVKFFCKTFQGICEATKKLRNWKHVMVCAR